jgi:hypothetical protein
MLTDEDVAALAEAGGAAPSGGNMQPWRVRASDRAFELFLDEERSTSFIDVDRLGSILGLGSFTENVCLAADARGLEHEVEVLGFEGMDAPIVRISFGTRGEARPSKLHDAIFERGTNRQPGDGTLVDAAAITAMREAVAEVGGGCVMHATSEHDHKKKIAEALGEADVIRTFNDDFHQQMLSEMRWTPEEAETTRDGVDVATLELGAALTGLKLMRYKLFVALMVSKKRVRTMTEDGLAASSHLCALTMPKEATPEQLVTAGRALQRMWLTAEVNEVALQPWSVIPFFALRAERHPETLSEAERAAIADIDARVRALWDIGDESRAIFVFRLSNAPPPSTRALRRPWQDFTHTD